MKESISFRIGKGSLSHNSRLFIAENVDSNRTNLNIEYINENIQESYHKLFDEAVRNYNNKQTRTDQNNKKTTSAKYKGNKWFLNLLR